MKTNIISNIQNQLKIRTGLLDGIAKRIVMYKFNELEQGRLIVIDNNDMHQFGDLSLNPLKATITVRNPSFYSSLAFGGSVGVGEAYFQGDWDCDNLTNLIRIFLVNRDALDKIDNGSSFLKGMLNKVFHWINKNNRQGSRRNISAHYDIGNDLFKLMLDKNMMYSSAVYTDEQCGLETAAENKIDLICKKLQLNEDDHLLEIGTGWGGFAVYAVKNYGCRITTTTISKEQYNYTRQLIKQQGLEDKIELLFEDYRDLTGQYDKLVSIEMIEAVGLDNLNTYFNKCSSLLKSDGLMCIQAITIEDQRYEQARREVDFIQKYIFPGGSLPSITVMSNSITNATDMRIFDIDDIGLHYAKTLKHWKERFFKNEMQVYKLGYNEVFVRLWEFYLSYCEGGFKERAISTVHLLLTKPKFKQDTYY